MPSSPTVEAALATVKAEPSKILGLSIGTHTITPGVQILKANARDHPKLSLPSAIASQSSNSAYIAFCIDPDAPFPAFPFLGPILHWAQPGLKIGPDGSLSSTDSHIVNYIPPGPPPLSSWHRYVFLLYRQPEGFDVVRFAAKDAAEMARGKRMRFDFEGYLRELGLEKAELVAGNWFESKA